MRRHPLIATAAIVGLAAAACGDDDSAAGDGTPTIVVTTDILGDVVAHLTGDLAEVEVVMPAGADPHEFQPSARQAAALRDADVVVANGAGFEEGLEDAVHGAEEDGVVVFEAIDSVEALAPADDHEDDDHADEGEDEHADEDEHAGEGDEESDDHGHGDVDPHFFTDPARMATAAEALAGLLADEVPALDTDEFRDRAAAYVEELTALDDEVATTLAAVPAAQRKLVTDHDVFGYFADRYDFEIVGAVIPSTTTQAAPSAGDIDDLASTVESEGVPAVFADTASPDRLTDTLAAEVGDIEVVQLFSESLGEEGSGAETYLDMVRTNAERIAEAMAP